ncbi:MAG TPA: hypothetical protein VL754_07325 [Verrucomicrobiae bacterium]|nr:hypothetical protein [Verrucomicrobiae bacterium]
MDVLRRFRGGRDAGRCVMFQFLRLRRILRLGHDRHEQAAPIASAAISLKFFIKAIRSSSLS